MASVAAAPARQPFGELSTGRLQQLASAKNSQNGAVSPIDFLKPSLPKTPATKRTFTASSVCEDSENVDPLASHTGTKRKKAQQTWTPLPIKPFALASPEPLSLDSQPKADSWSVKTPSTAPAGRSPRRKIASLGSHRRSLASFKRIDPPFGAYGCSSSALPFSLDEALNNSLGNSASTKSAELAQKGSSSKWKFEIYEDSQEEEAAIIMEHSTMTLDLSSDDETAKAENLNRGKENTPPEGYNAESASGLSDSVSAPSSTAAVDGHPAPRSSNLIRRKLNKDEMDDGERTPLSDLELDPFFPPGCDDQTHIIVEAEPPSLDDVGLPRLGSTPFTFVAGSTSVSATVATPTKPVEDVSSKQDAVDSIVVFEDDSTVSADLSKSLPLNAA